MSNEEFILTKAEKQNRYAFEKSLATIHFFLHFIFLKKKSESYFLKSEKKVGKQTKRK